MSELIVQERQIAAADSAEGKSWVLFNGDSCEVIKTIPDNSIDMSIHSPPFANLYIYSDSEADMGNCATLEEFFEHYTYLIAETLRVTVPGRVCVVHCKDLPRYANRDGTAGLIDFPGKIIAAYEACGWSFHSRVTIWKCPVTERERTNNVGLLHKTAKRDRSQLRQGMSDYLLVFRKPPEGSLTSDLPVTTPDGSGFIEQYVGTVPPAENENHPSPFARKGRAKDASIDIWRRYAESVWWDLEDPVQQALRALQAKFTPDQVEVVKMLLNAVRGESCGEHQPWFDINQTDVLNGELATDSKDEKHICPLQIDLIRRAVQIWSKPGDVVMSQFAGIGSEGYGAILEGRRFLGIELKPSYFKTAQANLRIAEQKMRQRSLFT